MSTQAAIRKIAEGLYELADALFAEEAVAGVSAPVSAPHSAESSPFVDIPDEVFAQSQTVSSGGSSPQGALSMCPKHHVPYAAGTYGPFCKQATDDPAWGKQKGDQLWCRITPKNAAEWLRITAAA
jgi:hypothetical protein